MTPQLLEYQIDSNVRAFSTTRHGGVGEGAYASFNITHYCGDAEGAVRQNRTLLCQVLGINEHQLFLPRQVHGTAILSIDDDFLKKPEEARMAGMEGKDALITAIPGICIGVSTADCVPILLYDASHKVAAAVHAGWRGTVAHIVSKTVGQMAAKYDCDPSQIKAMIGPSISQTAFEVGKEVYAAFEEADFQMSSIARWVPTVNGDVELYGRQGKWHLDLWAANFESLVASGVAMENIQVANVCTFSSAEDFFSARKLGIQSGRIFSGIMMIA